MTPDDLIARVAELLGEEPRQLQRAGVDSEVNLQGWLGARNLRLLAAERGEAISPGFWIAEHHDGRCEVMFDESPYAADGPAAVPPGELRRALVLVPLDPSRAAGQASEEAPGTGGRVEALLTSPHAEDEMQAHDRVELRAGRGVVGDRYFDGGGTFSASNKHGQQLTLIEAEVLDGLRADGLDLTPSDARRNVVTRGIRLNGLVGQEFQVGGVRCIGRRLCEPCSHLQRLTGVALLKPMVHRGGLRADILTSGPVRVGDPVSP